MAEMQKLTEHGAKRGDLGLYASVRSVATALSCAMNERGVETPYTRQYFVSKQQGTQEARDLSLDRQVIDLHWLSIWAEDAESRWTPIYGGPLPFSGASTYAASRGRPGRRYCSLG